MIAVVRLSVGVGLEQQLHVCGLGSEAVSTTA
jgi:hypothetical protein